MEKLARALSVIQQGMLRNNPGHVKDSVCEATEVLSEMLNTHNCLLESGVEIQKRLESHPARKGWVSFGDHVHFLTKWHVVQRERGPLMRADGNPTAPGLENKRHAPVFPK